MIMPTTPLKFKPSYKPLNPSTHLSLLEDILPWVDQILIMTVNPGFSGQSFIEGLEKKVERAKRLVKNIPIAVDGGVTPQNAPLLIASGADILISASSLFQSSRPMQEVVALLRNTPVPSIPLSPAL